MSSNFEWTKYLNQLCHPSKLERDKGEEKLIQADGKFYDSETIISWINDKFNSDKSFENRLGSLTACSILLNKCDNIQPSFLDIVSEQCISCHGHEDYRIRILAGECMGSLCRINGSNQFWIYISHVINGVKLNLNSREDNDPEASCAMIHNEIVADDTGGWKSLETWLKCFQQIINGIGTCFEEISNMEILAVIFEAVRHIDRYVRETCYELLGTVAENRGCVRDKEIYVNVCKQLRKGLMDNWSQVRMAASIATRKILLSERAAGVEENQVYSTLLPGICMNRYYLAEGVRLHNQETWKMVVGDRGKELIEIYLEETVSFYVDQSDAENNAVREAACTSMSEIAAKLNKNAIRPYLTRLLDALIVRFDDDSWGVRDMACLACGRFVAAFPTESQNYRHDAFIPLFLNNVVDSNTCIRESGVFSLVNVVNAYNSNDTGYLKDVINFIVENLENIKYQEEKSTAIANTDNDSSSAVSSDSQTHSYRSVSPRRHKGMPRVVIRDSEPWEKADGCILLMAKLVLHSTDVHTYIDELISSFVTACNRHYNYPQYAYLLSTACNAISDLCEGLGKQRFKHYLSDLLSIIDASISCDSKYTVSSAENTVRFLSSKLGPNILRGRIEMHSGNLLSKTEKFLLI